jgi:hypothetical protein
MHTLMRRLLQCLLLGALPSLWAPLALAQAAGQVEYASGAGFAQAEGQPPRALGRGLELRQGDRLTTVQNSSAIVQLSDGTRMTLRPNTEMVLQRYDYRDGAANNSLLLQLLRGGLRAVTGLIAKGSPEAAKIRTNTATVGIRGTDFDVRLCGPECRAEGGHRTEKPRPNVVLASAKLLAAQGEIFALDGQGTRRRLVDGASVYPGDVVETAARAQVVLAFRDDSRLTLGPATQFRVDAFAFDDKNPADGRFLVSLLRGSLRALTGWIGKANSRNVGFITQTATVGIRGTGLDLDCSSAAGCAFFTWLGAIEVRPQGETDMHLLQAGQGLFVGPGGIQVLTAPTLQELPRPDQVPVDAQQLFSSGGVSGDDEGLFVYVRDGHIEITTATQTLHLGRGETGYAGADGHTGRPENMPGFIQFDATPMPNSRNPMLINLLQELGVGASAMCR